MTTITDKSYNKNIREFFHKPNTYCILSPRTLTNNLVEKYYIFSPHLCSNWMTDKLE